MTAPNTRYPWVPYVLPFALFMVLLGVAPGLPLPYPAQAALWLGLVAMAILLVSRPVLDLRPTRPVGTAVVGLAVCVLWILPDQLIPGYRESWLFQNALTGTIESSVPVESRGDSAALALRFLRAVVIVPIAEELFWRGWLVRWIDRPDDFRARPLGRMSGFAFGAVAVLFALEHGAYWDVGLVAGLIYNWWMMRTGSLGDLIWAHAITNAALSIWVIGAGQWQYW